VYRSQIGSLQVIVHGVAIVVSAHKPPCHVESALAPDGGDSEECAQDSTCETHENNE